MGSLKVLQLFCIFQFPFSLQCLPIEIFTPGMSKVPQFYSTVITNEIGQNGAEEGFLNYIYLDITIIVFIILNNSGLTISLNTL